jgi:alpha-aminoadipic semialdehyde synthase
VPALLGIRREDKNAWERRVPLTPDDVASLGREHGVRCLVQTSPLRVFPDDEYRAAGAEVSEDLDAAGVVLAVKEIPTDLLRKERTYVYFSHVIKGQPYNMPMLQRLLDLGATLVDYEKITDDAGRRLIFFSLHAGYAGMIETLHALARRQAAAGLTSPLSELRQAYEYASLAEARDHIAAIGARIAREGLPGRTTPLIVGLAGYGNVSAGCQEILACLPVTEVPVADLPAVAAGTQPLATPFAQVVFREEDMVEPRDAGHRFALQDYYDHPEKYDGTFARHLEHLDVLVNTIYWDARYPRLVTREWVRDHYGPGRSPRLQVIGDISCDIEGGIEPTLEVTMPDQPCYVYEPASDTIQPGVAGDGPVIMAVDNLPCELPRESSEHFGAVLRGMVPALVNADWQAEFAALDLPATLKRAVIVHRGRLTPDFEYLREHLPA